MPFKERNHVHFARRIWHTVGVLFMFTLYLIVTPQQAVYIAIPIATFMVGFDWLRLRNPTLNQFFIKLFGPFMREQERKKMAASSAMMLGVTFIICFFPRNVVLLALLFLAFADPVASYFGIRYGEDKLIGNKTLQGFMAAFATCFVLSWAFFEYMQLMPERQFIACLLAGFIGAFSELVPIGKLDDNFVFPVLSAAGLYVIYSIFGGLVIVGEVL